MTRSPQLDPHAKVHTPRVLREPPSEWIVNDKPELAIVARELLDQGC